jgi:hypothetical protein
MIIFAALGGLLAGLLVAVAWTAGYRQGRHDVLIVTRAFTDHDDRRPISIIRNP